MLKIMTLYIIVIYAIPPHTHITCHKKYAELAQKLTDADTENAKVVCIIASLHRSWETHIYHHCSVSSFITFHQGLTDLSRWLPTCYLQYQHVVDGMKPPAVTWRLVSLLTYCYTTKPIWQHEPMSQSADHFATPPPKPPAVAHHEYWRQMLPMRGFNLSKCKREREEEGVFGVRLHAELNVYRDFVFLPACEL